MKRERFSPPVADMQNENRIAIDGKQDAIAMLPAAVKQLTHVVGQ